MATLFYGLYDIFAYKITTMLKFEKKNYII